MTTRESKGRFFHKTNRFYSIRIMNRFESRIGMLCGAVERSLTGHWARTANYRHCTPCADFTQRDASSTQWVCLPPRRRTCTSRTLVPSTHHSHHPSPLHSFIAGLNPSFSSNPSHRSLLFLLQDWPHGFPGLFIDTSEHVIFYFLVFLFFFLFSTF